MPARRDLLLASLAAPFVLTAREAGAHHGFTGRYDRSRPIALTGTVRRATFAPPHPTLAISVVAAPVPTLDPAVANDFTGPPVVRPEDDGAEREIEFPPIRLFYDLAGRVRVGDRVTVIALRNCQPPHQLRSQWLRLPDGALVLRTGGLASMVDGCR